MAMDFKFGTMNIYELGKLISNKLKEDGIESECELNVFVNEKQFKKIDEDLYYRNKTEDSEKFIPSEGEIIVKIDNLKILIKTEK